MICLGRGGRKRCCWWYGGGLSSSGSRWAFGLLGLSPLKMDSGGKWFLRLLFVHAAAASMASHALSFFFLLLPFYSWLLLLLLPLLPNEIGGCPMSKARMSITLFSSMLLSRRLCHVALCPLRCRLRRPNRKGLESCKVDEQRRL